MNEEVYQALKRVIGWADEQDLANYSSIFLDIRQIKYWIDEVAKEYEENCVDCGETIYSDELCECEDGYLHERCLTKRDIKQNSIYEDDEVSQGRIGNVIKGVRK